MSLILAANAGSSSLKISLYQRVPEDPKAPRLLLTSTISSISSPPAKVSFRHANIGQAARYLDASEPSIIDHESAFIYFLDRLKGDVSQQVKHICHRVVHGGDYTEPTVISEQSYHHIKTLSDLAPLRVLFNSFGIAPIKLSSGQAQWCCAVRYKRKPQNIAARTVNCIFRH
jgi:acetate kinase